MVKNCENFKKKLWKILEKLWKKKFKTRENFERRWKARNNEENLLKEKKKVGGSWMGGGGTKAIIARENGRWKKTFGKTLHEMAWHTTHDRRTWRLRDWWLIISCTRTSPLYMRLYWPKIYNTHFIVLFKKQTKKQKNISILIFKCPPTFQSKAK